MPRVAASSVRLTDHARQRIVRRQIPHGAIWGAADHPFRTRLLPDGREVRTVPATLRSRRAWVHVVFQRLDPERLVVITAYPRGRAEPRGTDRSHRPRR